MRHTPSKGWIALASAVLVLVSISIGTAIAAPGPAQVGQWTAPFEEGGASPRCVVIGGRLVCKPTAVGSAVLPDGRVLYMNGIESGENVRYAAVPEAAPESRDSLSRVLDLTGGTPVFTAPAPEDGVASNPQIEPGSDGSDDPFGVIGAPGRPGDGLVGSLWGALGGPPQEPTSPPDDVQENDGDLFCTDMVMLSDGRILIAGGTDWYLEPFVTDRENGGPMGVGVSELEGLRDSQIYDPASGTYTAVGDMKYGRWYPGLVTMPDGKVFVASGVTKLIKSAQMSQVRRTETFDPATGTWTENYVGLASENSLPLFPRFNLMPNGKIFYAGVGQVFGPAGQAADEILWNLQQFWNPATKKWETVGPSPLGVIGGASQVMLPLNPPYNKATLLVSGGTFFPNPGSVLAHNLSMLVTVDKNGTVTNTIGPRLNNRRWYSSGVGLPDGTVFVTSGADKDEVVLPGTEFAVRQPELYNPKTNTFTPMARSARDRTYHNSALLLADGRVLVGGHAPIWALYGSNHDLIPGVTANNDRDASFEVWSPPYLFRGPRPSITSAPAGVAWGSTFTISTPDAGNIESVILSRLPSPQHIVDSDSRTIRLAFTRTAGTLSATAPPNGTIAPPGYYYLFINKKTPKGPVPSVARIVKVGATAVPGVAPQPYPDNAPPPTGLSASEPEDSSYINQPPPLPLGAMAVGMIAAGAGIPARLRRRELLD